MSITQKILVVGPSWVGDMVMAQSLFKDLKRQNPSAQIDVLAPAWTSALVDRMPEIANLVAVDFQHGSLGLGSRWRVAKSLRNAGYAKAIVLPNSLKAALVPFLARIPQRIGWLGEQRWGLLTEPRRLDKKALPMTVQRFLALGRERGQASVPLSEVVPPELQVDSNEAQQKAQTLGLELGANVLALCPGAEFGASKQWPAQHYAEVSQEYLEKGWQVWLLGSQSDIAICKEIKSSCDVSNVSQTQMLAGKTSLPDAVDLLSLASLVISNDSGLMHIAAALQKPLVAVYGSTDPGHTPPLSPNHAIARLGLDCSPCFKRECPLGHTNCLNDLSAQMVAGLAKSVVSR